MTPRRPWQLWVVTLGGSGLLPKMPGTYGSAVTAILLWLTFRIFGPSQWIVIGGLVVFSLPCVALGKWAEGYFGCADPGPVVIDEAAGICLTMLFQPRGDNHHYALALFAAFITFRLFDITKPPPVRLFEKLPGGWGILTDDLAAAVYANLLCQVLLRTMIH